MAYINIIASNTKKSTVWINFKKQYFKLNELLKITKLSRYKHTRYRFCSKSDQRWNAGPRQARVCSSFVRCKHGEFTLLRLNYSRTESGSIVRGWDKEENEFDYQKIAPFSNAQNSKKQFVSHVWRTSVPGISPIRRKTSFLQRKFSKVIFNNNLTLYSSYLLLFYFFKLYRI